jgi:CubicO group peptidase (beta-lactamase class C family)
LVRTLSVTLVLAVVGIAGCGDGDEGALSERPADVTDPSVEQVIDPLLPPGASGTLLAARDDEMIHCAGFGLADHEAEIPATCDTAYDVMSMTKQFTAAAILKLEMLGKLRVADPISEYLGPVPSDKREITVHQLLTHTSGLKEALGGDYEPLARNEMIAGALSSKLESSPGEEHHYSNLGYSLLAAIIEEASGKGYEEFLSDELFEPAGMTATGYVLPDWPSDQVAVEYDERGEAQGKPFDHPWAEDGPHWNLRGNGGLLSTARDMYRWHVAMAGDEVLDGRAKNKLFRRYVLEEKGGDSYYGYGWALIREDGYGDVAFHDGGNGWSFGVLTKLLDEGVTVFWITNRFRDEQAGWNLARLGSDLTRGVADSVLHRPSSRP